MAARDQNLPRSSRGWLGWLGLGLSGEAREEANGAAQQAPAPERRSHAQARQLDEVAQFIVAHQLEVSAASLSVAYNYLNATDSRLVRAVERRIHSREPLTREWLEDLAGDSSRGEDIATLNQLVERLETSIDELATTSRDAHSATSRYHSALKEHVSELEHANKTGGVIAELAAIARVMVRRTRDLERQMLRSEAQTRALRRRLSEARRASEVDHLTGLPNRRSFDATYREQFQQARAEAEPLCVAFCDIDNFKAINDVHGHDAGDRVLKLVADSFASFSHDRCHVARHGGEEFVMLMRGMALDDAFAGLDGLRRQLAERRLVNRLTEEPFGQVSFSAGIADVFACGDPSIALRAADAALFRAKRKGRNCVEIAQAEDCLPPLASSAA